MALTLVGEHPLAVPPPGGRPCRIATLFTGEAALVTAGASHAEQRILFSEWMNARRRAAGAPPWTPDEEQRAWEGAVDLIVEPPFIQIRPDPDRMALAYEAERLLQELDGITALNIRFLHVRHAAVRAAIRERGDYWRIAPMPQSPKEIAAMIERSRIAIGGEPIYYYNPVTGTRYLTAERFAALGAMDDAALRRHLAEIGAYARRRNAQNEPELEFFEAGGRFAWDLPADFDWNALDSAALRETHRRLAERFVGATPIHLRADAPDNPHWLKHMFTALMGQRADQWSEDVLGGVTPEFFLQIRWLPGARIDQGELMLDPIFAQAEDRPEDSTVAEWCDENVKGFIFNYVREFGNLEYVNIGNLSPAVRRHERVGGHQAYFAEVKHRGDPRPVLRILRLQKWDIHQHLDEGRDLLQAILLSEEYTEFILDRRLGCWQLGMPLPSRIMTRRVSEVYRGANPLYRNCRIWKTYFERDFIVGDATDRIPAERYQDADFALAFARLLGEAAASNLLVGRTSGEGRVLFDDGDEILVTGASGAPERIVVADHAGTFTDYTSPLARFAPEYARPFAARRARLADPEAFRNEYLAGLQEKLLRLQNEYRRRRRAFDTLFKHSKQDPGAFASRWRSVLARLDQTDMAALVDLVRRCCDAANGAPPARTTPH